jgi:uncharacterized protein DUF5329
MTVRRIRRAVLAGSAILAFTLAHAALAASDGSAKDEIDHLLSYVAASSCTFVRNGSEYPAQKARDHLVDKYRFAGSRIATAEQFIDYLATKSSLSGRPYHVHCGKSDEESGPWLNAELRRYRSAPHPTQASR